MVLFENSTAVYILIGRGDVQGQMAAGTKDMEIQSRYWHAFQHNFEMLKLSLEDQMAAGTKDMEIQSRC